MEKTVTQSLQKIEMDLYQHIFNRQQDKEAVPSNEVIAAWCSHLINLLYPELSRITYSSASEIEAEFARLEYDLKKILDATKACSDCDNAAIARQFMERIPDVYRMLDTDIHAILYGDPAAKSEFEVIRAYPGFYALSFYRVAHALHQLNVPLLPRILTEYAHSRTGIDIHPAAQIGEYFMIDHGTGVVIGETTLIGRHVKIYQGVTLGALSVNKSMANTKRHPTVEDHVIIYSGATILGGETVIGHHSVVGGNVWLTSSIPPGSLAHHNAEITVIENKFEFP